MHWIKSTSSSFQITSSARKSLRWWEKLDSRINILTLASWQGFCCYWDSGENHAMYFLLLLGRGGNPQVTRLTIYASCKCVLCQINRFHSYVHWFKSKSIYFSFAFITKKATGTVPTIGSRKLDAENKAIVANIRVAQTKLRLLGVRNQEWLCCRDQ